jgi:hypothetical protein
MNRSQPYVRMINPPKQRSQTPLSKLDVAALLGIIAICAFVASRFYVQGLSEVSGYAIDTYLTAQDYVQLSCSWNNERCFRIGGSGFLDNAAVRMALPNREVG